MRELGRQCKKRRLKRYYVRADGVQYQVWAYTWTAAQEMALDARAEERASA